MENRSFWGSGQPRAAGEPFKQLGSEARAAILARVATSLNPHRLHTHRAAADWGDTAKPHHDSVDSPAGLKTKQAHAQPVEGTCFPHGWSTRGHRRRRLGRASYQVAQARLRPSVEPLGPTPSMARPMWTKLNAQNGRNQHRAAANWAFWTAS